IKGGFIITMQGGGYLTLTEVITLKELKIFHKDLSNRLNNFFGRDIGILNGATDLGNKTIKQLKKTGENLQNYADAEIQTTTNIITKAMGKGKVLVSESDIKATQKAAAISAALMNDINAANDSIKKIREKADKNFAKSEERLRQVQERETALAEREKKAAALERQNRNTSMHNAALSEDISKRLKICQERECQLELQENSPHKFYGDKIAKLGEENLSLKNDISELKSNNNRIQENVTLLNRQLAEKEKLFARRLADREYELVAEYNTHLREKDKIIDGLKSAVGKAYQIICNICRAAAALWCRKGKFAEYCADFTPKQNQLMNAILDYGAKSARTANFPDLADKIDTEYFISDDIREEMIPLEPEKHQKEHFSR
ncbi:MAG: hypothetical protein NC452_18270, partial [Eubacterium sp.]|nr:hypothetical protein [Eubacterium sp.]